MSNSLAAILQWSDVQSQRFERLAANGFRVEMPCTEAALSSGEKLLDSLRGENGPTFISDVEESFNALLIGRREVEELQSQTQENRLKIEHFPATAASLSSVNSLILTNDLEACEGEIQVWTSKIQGQAVRIWSHACRMLHNYLTGGATFRTFRPHFSSRSFSRVNNALIAELDRLAERLRDVLRYVLVSAPEWGLEVPDHVAGYFWTVRVPPLAYLRAMLNLFWSAIRHPLSDTTIDLSTGRVLYRT